MGKEGKRNEHRKSQTATGKSRGVSGGVDNRSSGGIA
jgi:hypothetical protein